LANCSTDEEEQYGFAVSSCTAGEIPTLVRPCSGPATIKRGRQFALHADSEAVAFHEDDGTVSIETTGGRVAAEPGDWIIKHSAEDFALCRPDAFAANYEPV
jgi:hypothetical protein